MGWVYCISGRVPDGPGITVKVYKLEKSGKEVTKLLVAGSPDESVTQQRGQLQK